MKLFCVIDALSLNRRPPHRGAWIEMDMQVNKIVELEVAPRTGGRGLKLHLAILIALLISRSPPAQGGVD